MSISLEEGVATLQAMFEGVDREVIVAVLEANRGNMERSVDALLTMGGESVDEPRRATQTPQHTPTSSLPSDFLSIPSADTRTASHDGDFARPEELEQIHSDELFARMLQDQMVLNEIRRDPELDSVFSPPSSRARAGSASTQAAVYGDAEHSQTEAQSHQSHESQSDLREKLSSLSESAKTKLRSLSSRFSRRRGNENAAQYHSLLSMADGEDEETQVVHSSQQNMSRRANRYQVDE
eukprot:TRINITY_DN3896_c0_g2_i1.p1 TRINITY_DN3896_c0_g2~~TRINITY_DN3896_c0_g2_i1.p1  ORF type:complete len:238 (+),score=60.29 TRINITY_DN3896_c0_g2_i1:50-763(+)